MRIKLRAKKLIDHACLAMMSMLEYVHLTFKKRAINEDIFKMKIIIKSN